MTNSNMEAELLKRLNEYLKSNIKKTAEEKRTDPISADEIFAFMTTDQNFLQFLQTSAGWELAFLVSTEEGFEPRSGVKIPPIKNNQMDNQLLNASDTAMSPEQTRASFIGALYTILESVAYSLNRGNTVFAEIHPDDSLNRDNP